MRQLSGFLAMAAAHLLSSVRALHFMPLLSSAAHVNFAAILTSMLLLSPVMLCASLGLQVGLKPKTPVGLASRFMGEPTLQAGQTGKSATRCAVLLAEAKCFRPASRAKLGRCLPAISYEKINPCFEAVTRRAHNAMRNMRCIAVFASTLFSNM